MKAEKRTQLILSPFKLAMAKHSSAPFLFLNLFTLKYLMDINYKSEKLSATAGITICWKANEGELKNHRQRVSQRKVKANNLDIQAERIY